MSIWVELNPAERLVLLAFCVDYLHTGKNSIRENPDLSEFIGCAPEVTRLAIVNLVEWGFLRASENPDTFSITRKGFSIFPSRFLLAEMTPETRRKVGGAF